MRTKGRSVLEGLAERALSLGADTLEVEYKDGHEEVVARKGSGARSWQATRLRCERASTIALARAHSPLSYDASNKRTQRPAHGRDLVRCGSAALIRVVRRT